MPDTAIAIKPEIVDTKVKLQVPAPKMKENTVDAKKMLVGCGMFRGDGKVVDDFLAE